MCLEHFQGPIFHSAGRTPLALPPLPEVKYVHEAAHGQARRAYPCHLWLQCSQPEQGARVALVGLHGLSLLSLSSGGGERSLLEQEAEFAPLLPQLVAGAKDEPRGRGLVSSGIPSLDSDGEKGLLMKLSGGYVFLFPQLIIGAVANLCSLNLVLTRVQCTQRFPPPCEVWLRREGDILEVVMRMILFFVLPGVLGYCLYAGALE